RGTDRACPCSRPTEWRGWAALTIAAFQGARERAILHLSWSDLDWVRGRITWRARYDKQGREWTQPMTLAAYSALLTARWWRQRDGERGPWVFYSPWATEKCGREEPGVYGAQALWLALKKAEERAGVRRRPFRAVNSRLRYQLSYSGMSAAQISLVPVQLCWLRGRVPVWADGLVTPSAPELR